MYNIILVDISDISLDMEQRVKAILSSERMEDRLPSRMEKIEALAFLDEMMSVIKKPSAYHLILANDIKERELRLWWAKERHSCAMRNKGIEMMAQYEGVPYVPQIPEDPSVKGIFLTTEEKEMSNTEIWDKISSIQEEMDAFRKMKLSKVIERCHLLHLL
jgi:hypothetical protein